MRQLTTIAVQQSANISFFTPRTPGIKADIAEIKTNIAGLKTDVISLKMDMAEIKQNQ